MRTLINSERTTVYHGSLIMVAFIDLKLKFARQNQWT
jgi:hypothetical protein